MRKYLAFVFLLSLFTNEATAQSRGIRIGYIDMEFILQNVPDYSEAKSQLELKAQKWKQEIEAKKIEINKLKDALKTERVLLTKELIEEREQEISFQETELLNYQQKRFGPNGDLITQKSVLVKPIQDQVFTAVQDIAEAKKYDFIFDKSSDLTMLFSAKRHDVSDQVIRAITRAEKREQLSKKQLKEQEAKEMKEDMEDENPALAERKKQLEERKLAREKLIEDRKLEAESKKKAQEEKRKKLLEEKEAKKSGTIPANDKSDESNTEQNKNTDQTTETKTTDKEKILEDRKKAVEERRRKILEEREALKKAKEEKANQK